PRTQRRLAIGGGGVLAVILRIVLTLGAALLLEIPLLTAVGGLVLLWVAWGLLRVDTEGEGRPDAPPSLLQAIWLIVIADVTMSVDNVIAVAGTAGGDMVLLIAGLVISMPLLLLA